MKTRQQIQEDVLRRLTNFVPEDTALIDAIVDRSIRRIMAAQKAKMN